MTQLEIVLTQAETYGLDWTEVYRELLASGKRELAEEYKYYLLEKRNVQTR